jgi:quercetin dioxygenase-like cupin family protein
MEHNHFPKEIFVSPIPYTLADKNTGDWKEHPRFKGILIKLLLTSADNPHANINAVRVPPGCAIGFHTHASQFETIFVLAGRSIFTISGVEIPFLAGQIIAAPMGVEHSLRNDSPEMVELLTIFTPPS